MRRTATRVLIVALIVVASAAGRLTTQEAPAEGVVTIVLDLPSPVVAKESVRLTRVLLGELPTSLVRYFSDF